MNRLLNALRVVAREENAAAEACPTDQIPVVPEAVRADIAAAAVEQLSQGRMGALAAKPLVAARVAPAAGDQPGARRDQEARRQSRRRMAWSLGTATLAAAAALLLWYRPKAPAVDGGFSGLPDYAVTASGGLADVRGGGAPSGSDEGGATTTTAPVRLSDSSELRVICRPDTAVSGPVAVRAFLVRDGAAAEVTAQVQIAATGAIDLRVRGSQLRGDSKAPSNAKGTSAASLRIVVGRPRAVGEVAVTEALRAVAQAGRSRPDGAAEGRWLTVPLDLGVR